MAKSWANSRIDLHLDLPGNRVRAGLESALRDAVRTGRLRPGTRLPSSRALAADLGIARNTVADAYGQLTAEGWLTSQTGAGTWVARHRLGGRQPPRTPPVQVPSFRYDLRPGVPDLSAFPRRDWLAAARKALNAAPDPVLDYQNPRGLPQLRAALAGYLARARGVIANPEHIVICAGFAHGFGLLCQALRSRGAHIIAMEAYGLDGHRRLAAAHGLRVATLPLDAHGAVLDALGAAGAALLTPAHQFPLGVTLRPQRRRAAVEWAIRTGGVVIEDDYDGEFRYDRQPVGAMQALAPDHVVYAGTASKSLAPGLRVGWLVLPADLADDVAAATEPMRGAVSAVEQLTLAEFISSGRYDRQIRLQRLSYRRRRDRLTTALRREVPRARVSGIAAGLHAVVELAEEQSEADIVARAAAKGLAVQGLDAYRMAGAQHSPALVIGYGRPPAHAFTTAVARLCTVLAF